MSDFTADVRATEIRALTRAEVEIAVQWAAAEGWNPGLNDASAFLAQDPDGFLGVIADGELVSCISAVTYGPAFGFVGFYICRPDMRGRGYGMAAWRAAMARLGDGKDERLVGLDGVLAQQENYQRSGFTLAHRNIRYGGPARALPGASGIAPVDAASMPALLGFDRQHFLFDRPHFLEKWLTPQQGVALAARTESGEISGYGVVRRCLAGHKIGPLFAADDDTARALYAALSSAAHAAAPEEPLFLDVPEPNASARLLADEAGLAPVFETARMYLGEAPDLPLERIYGITSFELG